MRIAVVLARKGSVRLPGKNVMQFNGKPMVSWAYERGLGLVARNLVDQLVVSTDDEAVMALAPSGVTVVQRPAALASSTATSFDAMVHAIETVEQKWGRLRHITLLQPTSPLASIVETARVVSEVDAGHAESAVAVCGVDDVIPETDWKPAVKSNGVRFEGGANAIMRVQDTENPTHIVTGSAYTVRRDPFLADKSFFLPGGRCAGILVSVREAVDIDTKQDFEDALKILAAGDAPNGPGTAPNE